IATSFGDADNDQTDLTTMIIFDRWWAATGDFDQVAVSNKKSLSASDWQAYLIAGSVNNEIEPGLSYDPAYNNFLYTYFDSTAQQLPYLVNDFNVSPSWNLLNTQYNDVAANLVHPHPQVIINPLAVSVGHTWIEEGAAGKGIAMFDAENSTYNGTGKNNHADWITLEAVSPNPASTTSTFTFSMTRPETISVKVSDLAGRQVLSPVSMKYDSGKSTLTIGVSTLNTGTYIYEFIAGDFRTSGKLCIVR
ncbi:MAG TPA: T9SS type A sorting domain-containing protein, partial [Bacteroidales bacterium]|nr:T9SS type A sorting domain-containing protein [Bacteroidales bacterium]